VTDRLLPPLRDDLDVMPSPLAGRPGLLIRDPMGFAEGALVIPPALVPLLAFFDGRRVERELRATLVRAAGEPAADALLDSLGRALGAGFLDDAGFAERREARRAAFARARVREPAHAGSAYPGEAAELRATLDGWLGGTAEAPRRPTPLGIAAPHVSPEGGLASYRAAYAGLPRELGERCFVVLGTSHYGPPERFGLTRKPFRTPYGVTRVAPERVAALAAAAPEAVAMEDYCHAVEHSIEFQVLFLQHYFGPGVRVLPVLCGPFAQASRRGWPEDDPGVARFLAALRELAESGGDDLFWVLGVDMAHVGRRYGDDLEARADQGPLAEVARRDRERLAEVEAGDARGFWALLRGPEGDGLRWCGASPLYSFLTAVPGARAELLRYEQWNIDEASVVSFAGLGFHRADRPAAR
jgi:hypothetical protein